MMPTPPTDLVKQLGGLILRSLRQFLPIAVQCHQALRRLPVVSASKHNRPVLAGLVLTAVSWAVASAWFPLSATVAGEGSARTARRNVSHGQATGATETVKTDDPEKRPDQLDGAPTDGAPFRVRLDDGAVIELAAIGIRSEEGDLWWDPAGADLDAAPILADFSPVKDVRIEPMKDHLLREVIVRVWKPERARIEVRQSGPIWGSSMDGPNYIRCRLQVPLRIGQTDLEVRYSNGPWKVAGAAEANAEAQVNGVHFFPFFDQNGRPVCRVEHSFADYERRIVAFDKSGKWHAGVASSHQISGKILKDTTEFRNVPVDELARIVFEVRPVTIVEFRNVALHRGKSTKPEVRIDGKPRSESVPREKGRAFPSLPPD